MPPKKIDSLPDDVKPLVLELLRQNSELAARVDELVAQTLLARIAVTARDKLLVFATRRDVEATNNESGRALLLIVMQPPNEGDFLHASGNAIGYRHD